MMYVWIDYEQFVNILWYNRDIITNMRFHPCKEGEF